MAIFTVFEGFDVEQDSRHAVMSLQDQLLCGGQCEAPPWFVIGLPAWRPAAAVAGSSSLNL